MPKKEIRFRFPNYTNYIIYSCKFEPPNKIPYRDPILLKIVYLNSAKALTLKFRKEFERIWGRDRESNSGRSLHRAAGWTSTLPRPRSGHFCFKQPIHGFLIYKFYGEIVGSSFQKGYKLPNISDFYIIFFRAFQAPVLRLFLRKGAFLQRRAPSWALGLPHLQPYLQQATLDKSLLLRLQPAALLHRPT